MTTQPGKPMVTTAALVAILSLSLVVNLPGLAVSPMLSTLSTVFPGTTQFEKQLLTVLPNLLIIPFVLCAGKLSLTRHKMATIFWALVIFTASAVAYLFARSMVALIVISCLLGCGAGLVIPFANGLIAEYYTGNFRMKMMGIKSGVANVSLVVATFAVGWLSKGNWHLPFTVYLIVLVPLALWFNLRKLPAQGIPPEARPTTPDDNADEPGEKAWVVNGFYVKRILKVMGVYFFISFTTIAIALYGPFMIQDMGLSDTLTGTITSVFYLFIFLPGFFLPVVVRAMRGWSFLAAGGMMLLGMVLFTFVPHPWALIVGSALTGLGYGICQPLIYDKTSLTVDEPRRSTMAMAIVLSANYVAIVLAPVIIDGCARLFHRSGSVEFPFVISTVLLAAYLLLNLLRRNSFAFVVEKEYYS